MAYDEGLAQRIREALEERPGVSEKKMFGGLCFLVSGNMSFGVVGDELMVRVGPDRYEESLSLPHARAMDFTGRPMKGMVYVATAGFDSDADLEAWLGRGLAFAEALPAKQSKGGANPH
jgi:TfoX/Sxy family transcriptional regulator of competence genes